MRALRWPAWRRGARLAAALALPLALACSGPAAGTPDAPDARLVRRGLASTQGPELDLAQEFGGFDGCLVLRELNGGETRRYHAQACAVRAEPCSTFKVFNALVGLQTGVLQDENTVIAWDGTPQARERWQHDHTLASAVRDSVVPYFQHVAAAVGEGRMQFWLGRVGYGNADLSSGLTTFWLYPGSLQISADEQVEFLARLYGGELPFDRRAVDCVRGVLVLRDENGIVLSGKTGTGGDAGVTHTGDDNQNAVLGWFIGHLRTDLGEFVVATRITGASGATGLKARAITEAVLRDVGLMD